VKKVEVGEYEEWAKISDHVPLTVEVTLGLDAPLDSCCPDCKQEKIRRPAYPDGDNPFALWLPKIKNSPRLGYQNPEALLWVLSEPTAIELVARRCLDCALRTFSGITAMSGQRYG
jgi:hypothetical protein